MGLIELSYYIEVNLICIFLLMLVFVIHNRDRSNKTMQFIIYRLLVVFILLYCISDIFAWAFDGGTKNWHRYILIISNLCYIGLQCVISYLWVEYVNNKLGNGVLNKAIRLAILIPMVAYLLVLVTSPFTGLVFYVDENNVYHRGVLAMLGPVICWCSLVYVTIRVIIRLFTETVRFKKHSYLPLIYFIIPPVIGSALQAVIFGLTTTQVGFTMAIMLIYMFSQNDQISQDELTGLNNRREIDKYFDGQLMNGNSFFLCMIDVDRFKSINDTYGHVEGDAALKLVSRILKMACSHAPTRLFLARYGGDEFVIAGIDRPMADLMNLLKNIQLEADKVNAESKKPYKIELSLGYTTGKCADYESAQQILEEADEAMYKVKQERKRRESLGIK